MRSHPFFSVCLLLIHLFLMDSQTVGASERLQDRFTKEHPLLFGLDLDYPPLEYLDETGAPKGCDVEFTRELLHRMDINFIYQPNTWENISDDVISGKVDLGMMVYSPYRKDILNYSRAVIRLYYQIVHRKDADTYFDMRNLRDKEVAFMLSKPVRDTLTHFGAKPVVVRELGLAFQQLAQGKYDAIICFRYQAKYLIDTYNLDNLVAEDFTLTPREYCLVSKDKELIEAIDQHVTHMHADGTIDRIYDIALHAEAVEIPQWLWYAIVCFVVVTLIVIVVMQLKHSKRLNKEMERAKRSEQLKTILLGNVSHALRTPLNAIIGFSDVLCTADDGKNISLEERQMLYGEINKNGHQLFHFINELLLLSNLESSNREFNYEICNIEEEMEKLEKEFKPKVKPKVNLYISKAPLVVNVDIELFRTLIYHLLSNAVSYTEEGTIEVSYNQQDDGLYFEVKDTGQGIPESMRENIFALLSDKSTYMRSESPGLGLTICRAIINLYKGKIGAKSAKGEGSTFWIWIPIHS